MSRHTIVTLSDVEAAWGRLLVKLIADEYDPHQIALMRLAFWYATFTIAPSYADDDNAKARFAVGPGTHVSKMGEGSHEQAHR